MSLNSMAGWRCFGLSVYLAFLSGCGDDGPQTAAVRGTVTFHGTPVESGLVQFEPFEPPGPITAARIDGGAYALEKRRGPIVGRHRVKITASRKTGRQIPAVPPAPAGSMVELEEQFIPPEYNDRTTLEVTIESGDNQRDFPLPTPARSFSGRQEPVRTAR